MTIDEMEAGRELNVLVAEKVMKLRKREFHGQDENSMWDDKWLFESTVNAGFTHETDNGIVRIPHYSIDISMAWGVIERLMNDGVGLPEIRYDGQLWVVAIRDFGKVAIIASAESVPLAICRAAIKAVTR